MVGVDMIASSRILLRMKIEVATLSLPMSLGMRISSEDLSRNTENEEASCCLRSCTVTTQVQRDQHA